MRTHSPRSRRAQGRQGIIGGEEGDGDGGRGLQRQARGNRRGQTGLDGDMAGESAAGEGDDGVAGLEMFDASPDRDDMAGAFKTKGRTGETFLKHLVGQNGKAPHHVAEVEAARRDGDLYLAGSRRTTVDGYPADAIEAASIAFFEAARRGGRPMHRHMSIVMRMQTHHSRRAAIDNDVGLCRARKNDVGQALRLDRSGQDGRKVDAADVVGLKFVGEAARESAEACLDSIDLSSPRLAMSRGLRPRIAPCACLGVRRSF